MKGKGGDEIAFTRPFHSSSISTTKEATLGRAADARKLKKAFTKIRNSVEVDLAFLFDATSSMSPYIQKARDTAIMVSKKVQRCPNSTVRYALVAYRDYDDNPRVESMDFTTDVLALQRKLSGTVARWRRYRRRCLQRSQCKLSPELAYPRGAYAGLLMPLRMAQSTTSPVWEIITRMAMKSWIRAD